MSNNIVIDQSSNRYSLARNGNVSQGSFSPFGDRWSAYFDGSSNINTPNNVSAFNFTSTTDMTFECWFNASTISATNACLMDIGEAKPFRFLVNSTTILWQATASGTTILSGSTTISVGKWYHVAFTRSGNTLRIFLNGTQLATTTYSTAWDAAGATYPNVYFGANRGNTLYFTGYISNARLVKGTAVYTAYFSVPTEPITAIANTSLLVLQDGRAKDNSSNNFTFSTTGTVRFSAFAPFSLSTEYTINAPDSYCAYFSGTSGANDFLSVSNAALALGTGDFTIEGFVFNTGSTSNNGIFELKDIRLDQGSSNVFGLGFQVSGGYGFYFSGSGGGLFGAAADAKTNTWLHFAVTRVGTTLRCFIDGRLLGTFTNSQNVSGPVLNIGGYYNNLSQVLAGYISNFRIVKGTALYTTNFIIPNAPLTAVAGTVFLGLTGTSTEVFTDKSATAATITNNGQVAISTMCPPKLSSTGSYFFNGSSKYLTLPTGSQYNLGTGDFTIECWLYPTVYEAGGMMLIDARVSNSGVAYYFRTYPSGGTGYTLEFYDGAGNRRSSTYFPLNRWTHIALTRTGGVLRSFTNGVMETLVASGYGVTLNPGSTTPRIGENSTALSNPVTGYMSNFRIVKGTAVYTASFTPPTQDLTAISNTLLLTCQASNATGTSSTTIIDNSANNYTITITGDIKKTTVNPYGGMYATNPYDTTTNTTTKGSMHFDGTGDYLTPPTGTQYNLGTGDFTIEAWVYPTSYNSGYNSIIDARTSNSTTPYVFGLTITGYVEFYDGAYRTSTGIAPVGTWSHVAVSRNSGTLRIFLNGVIVYTLANYTTSLNPGSITPRIGGHLSGDAANFIGYISNFRLVNGTAVYTAAFTPSNAALSSVSDTLLLVKGNTPDVVDSSTKSTIEMVGQVKATSKVKKYGGNSLHFDGTGDYLSSPSSQDFNFGTGDFTIEMWVYRNRTSTAETLIDFRSANASQIAPWIYIDASNVLNYNVSAASRINSGATTLTTGVWYHIAVTRSGTSTKMFINGTQVGSTYTDSNTYIQSPVTIGWGRDTTALSGYMDDIRVTKGVARYTANFTAPTAEFPKK